MRLIQTALALAVATILCSLTATGQEQQTLLVNGHSGKVAVLRNNGATFVNVENLAQIAGGSITFQKGQITLMVPAKQVNSNSAQDHPAHEHKEPPGALSHNFMAAGVEAIGMMREWRSTLVAAMRNSFAVTGTWVNDYAARAGTAVRQAAAAAGTQGDHESAQLLTNEFNNVQAWSNGVVAGRQNLNAELAVNGETFSNDPQYQKIVACSHFLDRTLIGGVFEDDPSCH